MILPDNTKYKKVKVVCVLSHDKSSAFGFATFGAQSRTIDDNYQSPTVGKIYDAYYDIRYIEFGLYYIDYIGGGYWEGKEYFITLSEYREKQLNELGI